MFAIDLLRGKGLPIRSRPEGIVIVSFTLAVPLIAALVMVSCFLKTRIDISINNKAIKHIEKDISRYSDALAEKEKFTQQKSEFKECLFELSSSLENRMQWSPILVTLVEKLPVSAALARLEVKEDQIDVEKPSPDEPGELITVPAAQKHLKITLKSRPGQNCDASIKNFRNNLLTSPVLMPLLSEIRVSQGVERYAETNLFRYEMDCIFKPEL